jgi:hypothetical protein
MEKLIVLPLRKYGRAVSAMFNSANRSPTKQVSGKYAPTNASE